MRLCIGVFLLLAACNSENGNGDVTTAKSLRPFTFRHMTSGSTALDEAKKRGIVWNCKAESGELPRVDCDLKGDKYPDIPSLAEMPLLDTFVSFEDGHFTGMVLEFQSDDFDQMVSVLRQAYGEPCEADSKVLQNAFGAQFAGDAVTWCYAGGKMSVERHMKRNFEHGELAYEPTRPAVIVPEYTANSL